MIGGSLRQDRHGGAAGGAAGARRAGGGADYSDGYKFLEAVEKKDGDKVDEMLGKPGSTWSTRATSPAGETALHIAADRRDVTWMRFLLGRGANPNIADNARRHAADAAPASSASSKASKRWSTPGARVDDANATGETPLIPAVHRRDTAMMRVLLEGRRRPRPDRQFGPLGARLCRARGRGSRAAGRDRAQREAERSARADAGSLRAERSDRMAAGDDRTLDELRLALAPEVADAAVFDGWTDAALAQAAALAGVDPAVARLAFPGGAMDMIAAWIDAIDAGDEAGASPTDTLAALQDPRADPHAGAVPARCGRGAARRRCAARWRSMAMPQNLPRTLQARLAQRRRDVAARGRYRDRLQPLHQARASSPASTPRRWRCSSTTRAKARPRPAPSSTAGSTDVMRFEKAKAQLLRSRRRALRRRRASSAGCATRRARSLTIANQLQLARRSGTALA